MNQDEGIPNIENSESEMRREFQKIAGGIESYGNALESSVTINLEDLEEILKRLDNAKRLIEGLKQYAVEGSLSRLHK